MVKNQPMLIVALWNNVFALQVRLQSKKKFFNKKRLFLSAYDMCFKTYHGKQKLK